MTRFILVLIVSVGIGIALRSPNIGNDIDALLEQERTALWPVVVLGLATLVLVVFLARRRRPNGTQTDASRDALRVATRALDESRLKEKLAEQEKALADREGANGTGVAVPHFGSAPMRRSSNNVLDLDTNPKVGERMGGLPDSGGPIPSELSHDDDLYLQPFVNLSSGKVTYYDVLLRRSVPIGAKPIFDRVLTDASAEQNARFGRIIAERTIAASRQIFSSEHKDARLIVHLPRDLLSSNDEWRQFSQLVSAQRSMLNGVILSVDADIFHAQNSLCHDRVTNLHQSGTALACAGLNVDVQKADRDLLADFECVICDFGEAFRASNAPDHTDQTTVAAFGFFQEAYVSLCVRNVVTEGDAADSIDMLAHHASGPFFGEPKRLISGATSAQG